MPWITGIRFFIGYLEARTNRGQQIISDKKLFGKEAYDQHEKLVKYLMLIEVIITCLPLIEYNGGEGITDY